MNPVRDRGLPRESAVGSCTPIKGEHWVYATMKRPRLDQCRDHIKSAILAQKHRWGTFTAATAEPQGRIRTPKEGTHKDDTNAPHVCLAWVIITAREDLGGEIRVAAHNPRCLY